MPDYELHADFDRNGRLTATPPEYSQRHQMPGAILLANLDVDQRRLPRTVQTAQGPVTLDLDQPTKHPRDDELMRLLIRVNNPMPDGQCSFFLKVIGWNAGRVRLYDRRGRRIRQTPDLAFFNQFPVQLTSRSLEVKVELRTLVGSPVTYASSLGTGRIPRNRGEQNLRIELACYDNNNQLQVLDTGNFVIAPFLLLDNTLPVRQFYICELSEQIGAKNQPSVGDVEEVLRQISGVQLVKVQIPDDLPNEDCWLQDQFQIGYCRDADSWIHVVFHLPRMRRNMVVSQITPNAQNLSTFVTSHFPSRDVGVFNDFWRRSFPVRDVNGTLQSLSFQQSYQVLQALNRLSGLRNRLFDLLSPQEQMQATQPNGIYQARTSLPQLWQRIDQNLRRKEREAGSDEERNMWSSLRQSFRRQVQRLVGALPVKKGHMRVQAGQMNLELTAGVVDQLYRKLDQLHDGANYGGNIDVSPPLPGAPHGKIVIGNASITDVGTENPRDLIDPDLVFFLQKQGEQPIVELDVSWLSVGHIDEVMTFVPNNNGSGNFAILRASSQLALGLMRRVRSLYYQGLPVGHPQRPFRPSGIISRLMREGSHPVTHMFRGKNWLHHHPPNAVGVLEPPSIYRKMALLNARWGLSAHHIPYRSGEGADRHYPSGISVLEFLYFERDQNGTSTNAFIETQFLSPIQSALEQAFPNIPVITLPVLFDAVSNTQLWSNNSAAMNTVGFTPDVVNMQVVNGHLLIPKPYGPRMKAADVLAILSEVFQENGGDYGRYLNNRYLRSRGLTCTTVWVKHPIDSGSIASDVQELADVFWDGFPGKSKDEVAALIPRARCQIGRRVINNRRHFRPDGNLRDGWRKIVIPEDTVDLFEAYTRIVLEPLNVQVHFVDSWYYHVRLGEIHCGTNVMRQPRITRQNAWWRTRPGQ